MVDYKPDLEPYVTISPFKAWCQKVIPAVYDGSISVYEMLCKLTAYINQIISNMDDQQTDITNLLNAYNQLQDYVNNYFDSLDVQAEIDNKLDEMAENGTLGKILSNITQSYAINVVFSGVKNDGTNVTEELQSIINDNPYGVIYFPPGNYTFYDIDGKNCSLIFSSGAIVTGASTTDKWFFNYVNASHVTISGGVFKRGTENSKDLMPQVDGRKTGVFRFENCNHVAIKNIHVAYNTGNDMIGLLSCKNVVIENCCFNWMLDAGVHVYDSCNGVTIRNCKFTNAILPTDETRWYVYTVNVGLSSFAYAGEANKNVIVENCLFEDCEWEGIDSHGCINLTIRNNIIHNTPRFIMAYGDDRNLTPRQYSNVIIENNFCYNDDDYVPNIRRGSEDTFFGISVASFGESKQSNIVIANNRLVNTYLSAQSDASFIRTNNAKNVAVFNNRLEKRLGDASKNIMQHFLNTTDINVFNNTIMFVDCNTAYMGFYNCTGSVHDNHFVAKSSTPSNVIYFAENCFMSRNKNIGACAQSLYNDRVNNIVSQGEAVLSESDILPNGSYYEQNFTTGSKVVVTGDCTAGNQYFTTDSYYVTPALFGTLVVSDEAGHTHSLECIITWFEDKKAFINATIPANGTCTFTSFVRTTKRKLLENHPSQYDRTIAQLKETSDVEIRQVKIVDPNSNINGSVYQFINTLDFFALINPGKLYVYTRASDKWYGVDLTERDIH